MNAGDATSNHYFSPCAFSLTELDQVPCTTRDLGNGVLLPECPSHGWKLHTPLVPVVPSLQRLLLITLSKVGAFRHSVVASFLLMSYI